MKVILLLIVAVAISWGSEVTLNPSNFIYSQSIQDRMVGKVKTIEKQMLSHSLKVDRKYRRQGVAMDLTRVSFNGYISRPKLYTKVFYTAIRTGYADAILLKKLIK